MAVYTKHRFSGSTDGRGIKVVATATPGTLIHTAHATADDEIYLYVVNSDASDHKVTIEWGGVTVPDDLIEQTIGAESGLILIAPGLLLTNSLVVRLFAASANVVVAHGFVNRIT